MKISELHRQPKARKKKVWDFDEHQGKEGAHQSAKTSTPYNWPARSFHGQSEGHAAHQLSSLK